MAHGDLNGATTVCVMPTIGLGVGVGVGAAVGVAMGVGVFDASSPPHADSIPSAATMHICAGRHFIDIIRVMAHH